MATEPQQNPPNPPQPETPQRPPAGGVATSSLLDSGAQIAVIFLSLIGGIVLSRLLGAEGRGRYVFATYILSSLLMGLGNLGAGLAAQVFVARTPARLAQIHTLGVWLCLGCGWLMGGACVAAWPLLKHTVFDGMQLMHLVVVSVALLFQLYLAVAYGLLIGLGAVRRRAAFEIVYQTLQSAAVVIVLLFLRGPQFPDPVAMLVLSYFTLVIFAAPVLVRELSRFGALWQKPESALRAEFLNYGRQIWFGGIANEVSWRFDQFLVNGALGAAPLGIYNLATTNAARSALAAVSLTRSLYSRVCAAPSREAADLCARGFRQLLLIGLVMFVGGIAVVPLFPIVYGKEFVDTGFLFVIVLVGWLLHNASRMLSMYFTGHLVRPDIPLKVNWGLLPFQLGLTWFMLEHHGITGVAIATSISFSATAIAFVWLFAQREETPPLSELIRIRRGDIHAWIALAKRLLKRA
jgi:O-antigen/teichoic acid export membrane protein